MHYGLIPEFVGRLPVISAIHQLTRDDLIRILEEPRNALVKQFQRFFSFDGIELHFAEDALGSIADKALERDTGARGLRSILEEILLEVQFELPSRGDVTKCVVTKETVEKNLKPTLVTEGAKAQSRKKRARRPPRRPKRSSARSPLSSATFARRAVRLARQPPAHARPVRVSARHTCSNRNGSADRPPGAAPAWCGYAVAAACPRSQSPRSRLPDRASAPACCPARRVRRRSRPRVSTRHLDGRVPNRRGSDQPPHGRRSLGDPVFAALGSDGASLAPPSRHPHLSPPPRA